MWARNKDKLCLLETNKDYQTIKCLYCIYINMYSHFYIDLDSSACKQLTVETIMIESIDGLNPYNQLSKSYLYKQLHLLRMVKGIWQFYVL